MTNQEQIIGYAGLDIDEECYEYFENECCITDSVETTEKMMKESYTCMGAYKVLPITIIEIMKDFGCSCGSYAFEPEAYARFSEVAKNRKIQFTSRLETMTDPELRIVEIVSES